MQSLDPFEQDHPIAKELKAVSKIKSASSRLILLLLVPIILSSQSSFAQSTDREAPTALGGSTINRMNSSDLRYLNTYYYSSNITKVTLYYTLALMRTSTTNDRDTQLAT